MAAARDPALPPPRKRGRVQSTPEEREKQLQSKAFDLAEKQLDAGTASSQVITQLMKGASAREELEKDRLRAEVRMANARIEQMESAVRLEASIEAALEAFRSYQPSQSDETDD